MKTWMMVKSGIRKNRSSSITLVILITFATLCLNIGINVVSHMGAFIDDKNESLNGADYLYLGTESSREEAESILKETRGFDYLQTSDAMYYEISSIQNPRVEDKAQKYGMIFLDMEEERKISELSIIDAEGKPAADSIVVPYSLKTGSNYQVGDEVTIKINDKNHTYHIYGFSEDVMFATTMNINIYKCFIPSQEFKELYQEAEKWQRSTAIGVRLKNGYESEAYDQDVTEAFSEAGSADLLKGIGLNYTSMKFGTSATISIIMSILVVFASLIILISMIVIHFSVTTYIEEDIKNLGSMEAIGFTCRMIRGSLMVQFLTITVVGYAIGTILSYLLTNIVSAFVEVSIGLKWDQPMTAGIALLTFGILTLLILGTTYKVSGRMKKVTPIMALRNGIENYHFGKNHLPFETSNGSIHWILGMKSLLQNKKQNRSIGLILMVMSFCIVFVGSMYQSLVVDTSGLMHLIGVEAAQLEVIDVGEDHEALFHELGKEAGVKKTLRYKGMNLSIAAGDEVVSTVVYICDDFSQTETNVLVEGRAPEHDNEIAVSLANMEKLHTRVGDVVQLKYGDTNQEFVIVGSLQHVGMLGCSARITTDGMRRCDPKYDGDTLLIYCDENQSAKELEARIHDRVYAQGGSIKDIDEQNTTMMANFYQGITLTCVTISVITAAVSILILYYLVKMRINKEKVHYGIQKAVGFTTPQLVWHTILAFAPVAAVSSLAGAIVAALTANKIISKMLNYMVNLKDAGIDVSLWVVMACVCGIVVLTSITTGLVAIRIRKIDVRELVEV